MNTWISILSFGIVVWKLKNYFHQRKALEYAFQFKNIGLKLDLVAAEYNLKYYDARYKRYDNMLNNTIKRLPSLNLFYILIVYGIRREKIERRSKLLKQQALMGLKDRKLHFELNKINKDHNDLLFSYLVTTSVLLKFIVVLLNSFKPFKHLLWTLKEKIKSSISESNNFQYDLPFAT